MGLKVALHGSKFVFNRTSASILLKTHKSLGKRFIKRTNLTKSSETVPEKIVVIVYLNINSIKKKIY